MNRTIQTFLMAALSAANEEKQRALFELAINAESDQALDYELYAMDCIDLEDAIRDILEGRY